MVNDRGACSERVSDACQWALPDCNTLAARKDFLARENELDMCAREKVLLRRVIEGDDRFGHILDRACKAMFECIAEGIVYPVLAILSNLVWHSLCLVWELEPQKMFSKAHLRSELVDLESKYVQVNDSFDDARARFLKEITVLRDQIRRLDSQWLVQIATVVYEDEPVMYYEPLMYFSEPMRMHIAEIVEEKLKQALMKLRKLTDFREDGAAREDAAKRFESLYEESQATVFKLEAKLSHLQQECSRAEAEMCSLTNTALEEWKEVSNALSDLSALSCSPEVVTGTEVFTNNAITPRSSILSKMSNLSAPDGYYELPPDIPLTFSSPTGFSHVRPGDFTTSICSRSEYTAKALKRLSRDSLESIKSLKESNAALVAQCTSNRQHDSDAADAARRREQEMMSKALREKDAELKNAMQKIKELEQEVARLQAIIDRLQAAGLLDSDGFGFGGLHWKTPHGGVFERLYQDALDRKERHQHLVSTLEQARENGVLKIFNTSLLHYASYDIPETEYPGRKAFMDAISFPPGIMNIERDCASHEEVASGSVWIGKAQEERSSLASAVASHSEKVQTISFPPEQQINKIEKELPHHSGEPVTDTRTVWISKAQEERTSFASAIASHSEKIQTNSFPSEQQINKMEKELPHHCEGPVTETRTVALRCNALEAKFNSAKPENLSRKPLPAVQGRPSSPVMQGSLAASQGDSVMPVCSMKVLGRHLGVAQLNTLASEDVRPKELAIEKTTLDPVMKESCRLGFTSTLALACSRSSPNWQVSAASVWRPPLQKVVNVGVESTRPSSASRSNSLTRPRSATGLPSVGKLDRSLHQDLASRTNVGVQPLVALLGASSASPSNRTRPSTAGLSRQPVAQPTNIQLSGSAKKLTIKTTTNNGR